MQKKNKPKKKDSNFDEAFDNGNTTINFSGGVLTEGFGKLVKLPPFDIPTWLAMEIDSIAKEQANSRSSVIRQLLVQAIKQNKAIV